MTTDAIPRRIDMLRWTPGERAIFEAVQIVEGMGADVLLTETVVLLGQARDKVAEFVDQNPGSLAPPRAGRGARYRWNPDAGLWEFWQESWGGWCVLRATPSDLSPPMTYVDGWNHVYRPGSDAHVVRFEDTKDEARATESVPKGTTPTVPESSLGSRNDESPHRRASEGAA